MRDSYILGFGATAGFSPKSIKGWYCEESVTKRQTLYFVVKFVKLNKLKYNV